MLLGSTTGGIPGSTSTAGAAGGAGGGTDDGCTGAAAATELVVASDIVAMAVEPVAEWSIESCGSAGRVSADTLADGAAELLPGSAVVPEHAPTASTAVTRQRVRRWRLIRSHSQQRLAEAARSVDDRE